LITINPKIASMFDYDQPKDKQPVDYTGLKIVAILAPVIFLITFLANADVGLAACIVLGMIILAIKIRWNLSKHVWFWGTIIFILALHVPLLFLVRWPQGNLPTLFYTMPIGIADFFIILGAVALAERLFLKDSSS
jgi:4-amino-4-deoxy-L-arabinose transferase-like glycosyltransferase